jgi:hypothetical protein
MPDVAYLDINTVGVDAEHIEPRNQRWGHLLDKLAFLRQGHLMSIPKSLAV